MRRTVIAALSMGALSLVTAAQPPADRVAGRPNARAERLAQAAAVPAEEEREPASLPRFAPADAFHRAPSSEANADVPPAAEEAPQPPLVVSQSNDAAQPVKTAVGVGAKAKGQAGAKPLVAARTIFGGIATPALLAARSIGFYARGCLAGAAAIPINGKTWQVMRLSRNRNWGHPRLIELLERLAADGAAKDGWPGLLVGDISQPRGGPMLTGHASHQIGLDADVWLTPMPDRRLTAQERENLSATSMIGKDGVHADPKVFTARQAAIIRRAASYPQVERVLVNPGIKKAMCEEKGVDRTNFHKIRPYWGHDFHMHIRIACPPDSMGCRPQAATPGDDGCGKEIDDWIKRLQQPPPKPPVHPVKPRPPPRPITLDDLPSECRAVVGADGNDAAQAGSKDGKAQRAAHGR